jgi:predicted RNA-binding Zn ribbon-like protein
VADVRAAADRLVTFLNTLYVPDGDDKLADERASPWLSRWLDDAGHRVEHPRTAAAISESADQSGILSDLRDLREGLRNLVAPADSLEPDAEITRAGAIALAASVLRGRPLIVELGGDEFEPSLTSTDGLGGQAIAAVAAAYLVVRAGGDWPRLKVCADPTCRWAFLDTSRNRSRRWCDMADCGNRAKNRVWRERSRKRTTPS